MTNDIEKARVAREQRAFAEGAAEARAIATTLVEGLPCDLQQPLDIAVNCQALMIAAIAVCDACGTPREMAIQLFTNLAKGLTHPVAVIE
jgi:hypothetical protein